MDEAELAQVLGEAFRIYSSELKQGSRIHPDFKPLLEGKHATITIKLTKNNTIELVAPQKIAITMPPAKDFTSDLPIVHPVRKKTP